VRLADGREIKSNVVISNAGLVNTYNKLLPPDTLLASPQMQQHLQQAAASGTSVAVVVLYLGFNEPLVPEFQGFGTLRVYPSADHDGNYSRSMADPEAPSAIIEICCHDGREQIMTDNPAGAAAAAAAVAAGSSGSSSSGGSTVQVIVGANYNWFKEWSGTKWHQRGEGYEAFKQKLQDKLMQKLGELFPNLPGRVVCSELSTPLSTEHFARWPRGGIYGINASPERYRQTNGHGWGPTTPLPGLLLTGQDVVGDGIMPAFLSGTLAAQVAGGPLVGLRMMQEIWKWK
jgi:all-trans-retinol 13,14-reductase